MKKFHLYFVMAFVLALAGLAYAGNWVFVGEYDMTAPLATDATDLQKAEAFSKKFAANDSGITPVLIAPTVPLQKDGTITHVNKPSGATKNPALVNIYTWTPDTENAAGSASGIDLTQQKNWTGAITGTESYYETGKIFTIGSASAPQYSWIGISHPSLSGMGSATGKIHVYAGRP